MRTTLIMGTSVLAIVGALGAFSHSWAQGLPTAVIQIDSTSGPAPLRLTFDGSTSSSPNGPIQSYDWDFGDGATDTVAVVSHFFRKSSLYKVTLSVTDSVGAASKDSVIVTVQPSPPRAFIALSIGNGIVPLEVDFGGTGSMCYNGDSLSYSWDFDDGGSGSDSAVTYTFNEPGSYLVRLTVGDSRGMTGQDSVIINVLPPMPTVISYEQGLKLLAVEMDSLNAAIIRMIRFGTNDYADTTISPAEEYLCAYTAASGLAALYNARVGIISAQADSLIPSPSAKIVSSNGLGKAMGIGDFFSDLGGRIVNILTLGTYSFVKKFAEVDDNWIRAFDYMIKQSFLNPSQYPDAVEALHEANVSSWGEWESLSDNEKISKIRYLRASLFVLDWQEEINQAKQGLFRDGAELAQLGGKFAWNVSTASVGIPDPKVEIISKVTRVPGVAVEIGYETAGTAYDTMLKESQGKRDHTISKTVPDPDLPPVNETNAPRILRQFIESNDSLALNALLQAVDIESEAIVDRVPVLGYLDESGNIVVKLPNSTHVSDPIESNIYRTFDGLTNLAVVTEKGILLYDEVPIPSENSTLVMNAGNAAKVIDVSNGSTLSSNRGGCTFPPRQVKTAIMCEMLWRGMPQMLLTIMASCARSVPKAKQVRTLANPLTGICFCWSPAPMS